MVTPSKAGSARIIGPAIVFMLIVLLPAAAFAARPLITDDAGTVGKGTFQVELGFEMSDHRTDDDGVVTREDAFSATTTLSYGLLDNLDVLLGMPYEKMKLRDDGETVHNAFFDRGFREDDLEG